VPTWQAMAGAKQTGLGVVRQLLYISIGTSRTTTVSAAHVMHTHRSIHIQLLFD